MDRNTVHSSAGLFPIGCLSVSFRWLPLFLCFLSCSNELWPARINPKNCVVNPDACSQDESCNLASQVCEATRLSLRAVEPAVGPVSGGILLKVLGRKFALGAVVQIAGIAAAPTEFVSDSELRVTLPANPAAFGKVEVSVLNPDGAQVKDATLFSYFTPTLSFSSKATSVSPIVSDLIATDINLDGNADLVLCQETAGSVAVYLGNGRGGFSAPLITPVGFAIGRLALGDFNEDGAPDLAVMSVVKSTVGTMLSNRDGTFLPLQNTAIGSTPIALVVGKFDSDSHDDVFVSDNTVGKLFRLFGTGSGSLIPAAPVDIMLPVFEIGSYDMNGDGTRDFVLSSTAGQRVAVLLGDRSSTDSFSGRFDWVRMGYYPFSTAVGDFNQDGRNDFVASSLLSALAYPVLADGNGQYREQAPISLGPTLGGLSHCRAFDLNGDGLPDVICSDSVSASLGVLLGDGHGGFAKPIFLPSGDSSATDTSRFSVADFDRNGKPDIVFVSASSTQFTVMLNQSY